MHKNQTREVQMSIIRRLSELLPKSSWWIAGGWAIDALLGKSRDQNDIDIYVLEENISSAIKAMPFLHLRSLSRENNFFVERRIVETEVSPEIPAGTEVSVWIPKEAMEGPVIEGIPLVTPEFLYLLAQTAFQILSQTRAKEKEVLELLQGFIDRERLKKISSAFRYQLKER